MNTAIEYRYMDVPVEIHGTNDETAWMEIGALLIAVPLEILRSDHGQDRHQESDAQNNQTTVEIGCTEES